MTDTNSAWCGSHRFRKSLCSFSLSVGIALLSTVAMASIVPADDVATAEQEQSVDEKKAPVDFVADELFYDEENQVVRAKGHVELEQSGRLLKADEVVYNLQENTVEASGNVVLLEANGDVHFFDKAQLQDEMKDGFVNGLMSTLADGSRFTAEKGERTSGERTIMYDASYTPCKVCEEDPDKDPVWIIKAKKVTHDTIEKTVSYENAWFEVSGVPLLYTPYFSHPDGSVKRKSGFLTPSAGWNSDLGFNVRSDYYWSIAPDKDATVGVQVFSDQAPMIHTEWRQRFNQASLIAEGSITYSDRVDSIADTTRFIDDEVRGHLFGEFLWDVDEKWRAGADVQWASDDQYLRQYDISSDDVLENDFYVERFDDRNYMAGHLLFFQDIRVSEDRNNDQPDILPEVEASFIGDPNSLFGGRWDLNTSFLGVRRDGEQRDMNRMVVEAGWDRRLISSFGSVTDIDLSLRGDLYNVRDVDGQADDTFEKRTFGNMYVANTMPVSKSFSSGQILVEPKVAVSLSPDISEDADIPNEDSQDAQIDSTNLFEANRFPGLDKLEDQSYVTYGVKTGVYFDDGNHIDAFVGQSYRFEERNNPFGVGSGLSNQESDVVGQVTALYNDDLSVNYKFQLNGESLNSERHELDASIELFDRLRLSSRYLYASALPDTEEDFSREQINSSMRYKIDESWYLNSGILYDFGEDEGMRKGRFGFDYLGDCVTFSALAQRTLTEDGSGDSDTEIFFRIGLKNLGEFSASGLSLGGSED